MKTTRELREAQAELGHDLLKNEILNHLTNPGSKRLLVSHEAPDIRAKILADDFCAGRVARQKILHAAETWRTECIAQRVVEFLAAVREWDDFRPNADYEAACTHVTAQLATLTAALVRLTASSTQLTQQEAVAFFTSLLTVWDFICGLEEGDRRFYTYMVPA